jgi:hypothetical protein
MKEIDLPEFNEYPKELENTWLHVYKVKDHFDLSYIVSFYKNNDYPRGTVIVSPFLYHKYPDGYVIFDKQYFSSRIYGNPMYRGRGWWKWVPIVLRTFFYSNMNKIFVDATPERSMAGERSYKKALPYLKQKNPTINNGRMNLGEMEPPRDPTSPYIWYNNRVGGNREQY